MINETPFFFKNRKKQRLFGILHKADTKKFVARGELAIIYCHPLFEEKLHSHRVLVNFARYTCAYGFHVLRFDYFGNGESEGLFEEASISSRISDIFSAIKFVEDKLRPSMIFLLGLRMGATLAILSAHQHERVSGIVAWSPVIRVKDFINEMLRVNLGKQMVLHKKIIYNRDALVAQIQEGNTVNVEGSEISNPFFIEAVNIDLTKEDYRIKKPLLVMQISNSLRPEDPLKEFLQSNSARDIEFRVIKERKMWIPQKIVYSPCEELFSLTIKWMEDICTRTNTTNG